MHPDDESKFGALTVLKDLSEHLGLSLTQRDLKEVDYEAQQSHGTPNHSELLFDSSSFGDNTVPYSS